MTRSTLDTGMAATLADETLHICAGCLKPIDPSVCYCGETIATNRIHDNHSPVPMGCDCHRAPS